MEFKVNNEKCIHCGKCINDCMGHALKFDENQIPVFDATKCIKCQHCLAICPTGALSICGKNPEESDLPDNLPEASKVLNLIKTRRSYRHYKYENVDRDLMEKLKNMLNWTPTGVNNHRLHFSFIEDIEVMDDFRSYTNGKMLRVLTNPALKHLAGKFERYKNAYIQAKEEDIEIVKSPVGMPGRAIHNALMDKVASGIRVPAVRCLNCIHTCDPGTTPYCITDALIHAAKGELDDALLFCGGRAYEADHIGTVKEVIDSFRFFED